MSDSLQGWGVADSAVRVILLRVLPGHELEVGRLIKTSCLEAGLQEGTFRVFRLFGSYDLVFIQDRARLASSDFIRLGTLPYITGSSEYICYKWQGVRKAQCTFSMSELSNPLLALCFLKINPVVIQQNGVRPEVAFAEYIRRQLSAVQMVGTLGWFEVLLLVSRPTLGGIFDVIGNKLLNLIYDYENKSGTEPSFFTEKTLSLVGHALDVSDPSITASSSRVQLFDQDLKREDLSVHLSLSCKPRAMALLGRRAEVHFGSGARAKVGPKFRFGPRDLDFNVPLDGIETLNALICHLDSFRKGNQRLLIRTYTDIQDEKHVPKGGGSETSESTARLAFGITPAEAKRLLSYGAEGGSVASAIYRYNSLLANDIVADAFSDLLRFVQVTRSLALEIKAAPSVSLRIQLADRIRNLKEAIDQRAQGVYGGLEDSPFAIEPTGNGLVRVLKALDAYLLQLLLGFEKRWNGFALLESSSRFEHRGGGIVLVPAEASLAAERQWGLTHEAMHVLQSMTPSELSAAAIFPEDVPSLLKYRSGGSHWHMVHEMTADLLDYSSCCGLGLKEYLGTVWNYLGQVVLDLKDPSQVRAYLFRSFAVICYERAASQRSSRRRMLDPSQLQRVLNGEMPFFRELKRLAPLFSEGDTGETQYGLFVQEFTADFGPALPYLFAAIDKVATKPRLRKGSDSSKKRAITLLRDGRIVMPALLRNPGTIAWQLAQNEPGPHSDRVTLAWLLSLWHLYHVEKLGFDVKKLVNVEEEDEKAC